MAGKKLQSEKAAVAHVVANVRDAAKTVVAVDRLQGSNRVGRGLPSRVVWPLSSGRSLYVQAYVCTHVSVFPCSSLMGLL